MTKPFTILTGGKHKTAVVAFGGNALIREGEKGTFQEQLKNIDRSAEGIVKMVQAGWKVVITHGNGPQVGHILLQQEHPEAPKMPLFVCVAQSQALIGCVIQEALYSHFHKAGLHTPVVTLVTQVLVNKNDPAFKEPTKPIGPYYPSEKGLPIEWHMTETRKGFRRLVPSPDPKRIVEGDSVRDLSGTAVVIAAGGGGIPVTRRDRTLQGVDAVIDKDLAGQLLAEVVDADLFVILTDVPNVYLNYGEKNQKALSKTGLKAVKQYLKKGHFPSGSMGPKMEAAVRFLERRKGRRVIVSSLEQFEDALKGKAGTIIEREK